VYGSVYSGPGVASEERTCWKKEVEGGRSLKDFSMAKSD
jgi:hypothetical protein